MITLATLELLEVFVTHLQMPLEGNVEAGLQQTYTQLLIVSTGTFFFIADKKATSRSRYLILIN